MKRMGYLLSFWVIGLLPGYGIAAEYHVDRTEENLVSFVSESPLIDVEVRTASIDGYAYWTSDNYPPDTGDVSESAIFFEVQLNSLDAGNSMYNRHIRENYLETEKFPYASYKAAIASVEELSDSSCVIHSRGEFTIHGISNRIEIEARVTKIEEKLLVQCDFSLLATEFEIDLPSMMLMKVDDDFDVSLRFYLKPAE